MKLLTIIVLPLLLHTAPAKGQAVAFSSTAFVNADIPATASGICYPQRYECNATWQGRRLLIVGGISLVVGSGLLYWSAQLSQGASSPEDQRGLLPALAGFACLAGGAVGVLVGAGEFIGGTIHDKRHGRYSVIGSKNHVGIAYNLGR